MDFNVFIACAGMLLFLFSILLYVRFVKLWKVVDSFATETGVAHTAFLSPFHAKIIEIRVQEALNKICFRALVLAALVLTAVSWILVWS